MEVTYKQNFRNESGLIFSDISSEKIREYNFPNGKSLTIQEPLFLNVSSSGGHRLYTNQNQCYYIHPKEGWWIRWEVEKCKPHFVK